MAGRLGVIRFGPVLCAAVFVNAVAPRPIDGHGATVEGNAGRSGTATCATCSSPRGPVP